MVFSSLVFLFLFLPFVLIGNCILPTRIRNMFLLLASLLFYSWGEGIYVLLMLVSIGVNYSLGHWLDRAADNRKKNIVALGVTINLAPLFFFKYFSFACTTLSDFSLFVSWQAPQNIPEIHLPIGISFFTFQAISYVVDIYRRTSRPQSGIVNLGLYIALFPQLIAGPIVRYGHIAEQLYKRSINSRLFAQGIERFTIGLSKKVLLANPLGAMADTIFSLPDATLSTPVAWLGITSYTLQIYFDFSGYSDMAIGLGRMLGFTFPENFNLPYRSRSLREFWTRWHISLSTWFRDYLYIPLGGNRKGSFKTARNLCTVFLLCGLWHGASWNFVIWGMAHGFFLSLERTGFGRWLKTTSQPIQHGYVLAVVMICWVFFRAENLGSAVDYLSALAGQAAGQGIPAKVLLQLTPHFAFILFISIFFSLFSTDRLWQVLRQTLIPHPHTLLLSTTRFAVIVLLLAAATTNLATGAYNPFIYFRF